MAAKQRTVYVCNQCGYESAKWNGKCQNCGEWNTFEEVEKLVKKDLAREEAKK